MGKEFNVFITLVQEGATFDVWSPIQLSKAIHKEIGDKDEVQQKKAIRANALNGQKIKGMKDQKRIRGVIIPEKESMEGICTNIKNVNVSEAKRLKTKRDGVVCDSLSVLLTFEEERLPEKVFIGYMSYDVRMYIPPPLRCFKCQRYGHVAAACKGKIRCSKCGGEHKYDECEEGARKKCCNCGGEHSAAYGGCEVYKRMQEVQKVKVNQEITYAEAARRVPKIPQNVVNYRKDNDGCVKCDRIQEETLIVSKVGFVLFMAEIINCTAQTTSRTERIKIIVKTAEKYLDVKGLQWEKIRETLEETQQSQSWVGSS